MLARFVFALALVALPPLIALATPPEVPRSTILPAALAERARSAVRDHLEAAHAPRDACVVEVGRASPGEVAVAVWWPGDDQPTRLPRVLHYAYEPRSSRVLAPDEAR